MMAVTPASRLAATCFGGPAAGGRSVAHGTRCAACGHDADGVVHDYAPGKTFNDIAMFASPGRRDVCASCATLLLSDAATASHTGSGVATTTGFRRLLSNMERLDFLVDPPEPPFAVALVTAKRQHVWWMARTAYDRDRIPLQFGHRSFVIDRPRSISAADAVLEYERDSVDAAARDKSLRATFVFAPQSRDLKSSNDGQYTPRFQLDQGNHALSLKAQLSRLSIGDMWAMTQLRAAARELKVDTVADAATALRALGPAALGPKTKAA